jgi:putative CocE/NonD family hydrolase
MRAFFKKHCESSQHNIRLHIVRFVAIFLLSTLGTTVWAQDRTDIGAIPEAKYKIHLQKSVMIPMRDGVHLATDLYFPEGAAEPLPVVLIRTPYNKKLLRPEKATGYYRWKGGDIRVLLFAGQGYVVAVQDLRGRYESEGVWRVGSSERDDGSDTLDWITAQSWSSGKVGTYGCSYLGEDQLQLAATRNPHQVAAIPQGAGGAYMGTHRTFGFMDGGAFELATAIGWFPREGGRLFYRAPAGTPNSVIADTSDAFMNGPAVLPSVDYQKVFWWLPLIDTMKRIGGPPTYYEDFVSHSPDDPYWQGLHYISDTDHFNTPALHINSWYDLGINETFLLSNLMRKNGQTDSARENQFVIISPATHCESEGVSERTVVGERELGDARLDYYGIYLKWFDHWLKGKDNDVLKMPKVQLYVMGRNQWRGENEWPLARTRFTKYYLHSDGHANTRYGGGTLDGNAPQQELSDTFTYDPRTPVPSLGGVICCTAAPNTPGGSYDQSTIEMRSDVLIYTSDILKEGLEVTGPLELVLHISSSAKDTDFTAKLIDVYPDGRAYNLQDGLLRARYRDGYDKKVLMKEGEVYEVKLDLHAISNYFAAGHRIRLEVSSSNFPRLDRNLNTGGNNYDETDLVVAKNGVYHSANYPSYVILPVIP